MRIAVAPDSFKGTLTSAEAAAAMVDGFRRVLPAGTEYDCIPMADGGEGTVDAWLSATGAERIECDALDPLGRPIRAAYGYRAADATAVVELAAASGLPLLDPGERDPGAASTCGTGLVLRDAVRRGARRIVLGLGGSATNDGGAGILEALGARLLDSSGAPVGRGGIALERVSAIDLAPARETLRGVVLEAACDVRNPLCGASGAAAVYGPQKCAPDLPGRDALIERLDRALGVFARAVAAATGVDLSREPGTGAAGGTGFAVLAALGGALRPGAELVASAVKLRERVAG
ncbi:MAG: glycerate kinase, partial [Kiritimatiellae bacterium]|nr:glycerate kinase [Kiritimatiellia bacterium]